MSNSVTPRRDFEHMVQLGSASSYLDEIYEVVKALALFEGFSISEYSKFCKYMVCFGAQKGDFIIHEVAEAT